MREAFLAVTSRGRAAEFAAATGLGAPLARVKLRGRLSVESLPTPVELTLTSRGLWLVAARSAHQGTSIDLLRNGHLRYVPGRTRDQLIVDEHIFATAPGRSRAARDAITLARLRRDARPASSHAYPAQGSYLVREIDARAAALLGRELDADELVVAFVASTTRTELPSTLAPSVAARCYWLITDRRCQIIGLSELGDVRSVELDASRLELQNGKLDLVQDRALCFRQSSLLAGRLLALSRMAKGERLTAAAQLEWQAGHEAWAQRLLRGAADEHADAAFALELVTQDAKLPDVSTELAGALDGLRASDAPAETLAALWSGWKGSHEAARMLLGKLRPYGERAEPWALELHRSLLSARPPLGELLDFCDHLLCAEQADEAHELLTARLSLSAAELDALTCDPAAAEQQHELVRAYDLLAGATERLSGDTLPWLWVLARLEPLAPERLTALERVAPPELGERVRAALAALAPGAFAARREQRAAGELRALPRELLEKRLRHPLARTGAVGTVQAALASGEGPDRELLRSWCERISPARYPSAARAAEDACRLLGVPQAELFVSRGERSLGVHAFAGKAPILVIGSAHLDAGSDELLGEDELRFVFGSELAHVRFGHERATPREVWLGALSKARLGMEVMLAALPLAQGLKLGAKASRLLERVPTQTLQRALGLVLDLQHALERREHGAPEVGRRHEQLVAAHRLQQLTADRAGLLTSGDLAASLSAMFALRADHRQLLQAAGAAGLGAARRDLLLDHPELLLRLRALVSFYLSPDYAALSGAARSFDSAAAS